MPQDGLCARWSLTLPLALVTLLAGCCKTTDSGAVCAAFRPISWSVEDTPETIAEIKAHNARRMAWCDER